MKKASVTRKNKSPKNRKAKSRKLSSPRPARNKPLKGANNGGVFGWIIAVIIAIVLAGIGVFVWRRAKREKIINEILEKAKEQDEHTTESLKAQRKALRQLSDKNLKLIQSVYSKDVEPESPEEKKAFNNFMEELSKVAGKLVAS